MDNRSAEDMKLLVKVGRQMSHLLNDLLDAVRLREKRIVLHAEPLSLPSIVNGVIDILKYLLEGKAAVENGYRHIRSPLSLWLMKRGWCKFL